MNGWVITKWFPLTQTVVLAHTGSPGENFHQDGNPPSKCFVEIGISTTKMFATIKDVFCPK